MLPAKLALMFGVPFLVVCSSGTETARGPNLVETEAKASPTSGELRTFRGAVLPALKAAGCTTSACHSQRRAAGGLALEGEPNVVYNVLRTKQGPRNERLVHLEQPEASTLLTKPQVGAPARHAGGKTWGPDDPHYRTILAWIQGGAPND